jgi:hypothetical protein
LATVLCHASKVCQRDATLHGNNPAHTFVLAANVLQAKVLAPMAHRTMRAMGPVSVQADGLVPVIVHEHLAMLSGEAVNGTMATLCHRDVMPQGHNSAEAKAAPRPAASNTAASALQRAALSFGGSGSTSSSISSSDSPERSISRTEHSTHTDRETVNGLEAGDDSAATLLSQTSSIVYGATAHPRHATAADVAHIASDTLVVAHATWKHLQWFAGGRGTLAPQSKTRLRRVLSTIHAACGAEVGGVIESAVAIAATVAETRDHKQFGGTRADAWSRDRGLEDNATAEVGGSSNGRYLGAGFSSTEQRQRALRHLARDMEDLVECRHKIESYLKLQESEGGEQHV